MGMFAAWAYVDGVWQAREPGSGLVAGDNVYVDVHDSDIATVAYAGSDGGGVVHLGVEPRVYFGTDEEPVDRDAEAAGLARWAAATTGTVVSPSQLLALLPTDEDDEPLDVFAEETLVRLLDLLGTGRPDELADVEPEA